MVDNWCEEKQKDVEIVVNDWAVLSMVKKTPHLKLCMGTLLNKRKKDPRMKYKKGALEFYSENSLNADFTEIFYGRSADFSALNGRAVVIISVFRKEKTVCIFLFIRRILPSTVRFMQSAQKESGGNRAL